MLYSKNIQLVYNIWVCSSSVLSLNAQNNSFPAEELQVLGLFWEDGWRFIWFHYNAWLIYSLPLHWLLACCGPVRMLGAEALMKHSCVQGVFSEESTACLSEGSRVTMQEPWARSPKSNSTSPCLATAFPFEHFHSSKVLHCGDVWLWYDST